jgi:hypothetical protein
VNKISLEIMLYKESKEALLTFKVIIIQLSHNLSSISTMAEYINMCNKQIKEIAEVVLLMIKSLNLSKLKQEGFKVLDKVYLIIRVQICTIIC